MSFDGIDARGSLAAPVGDIRLDGKDIDLAVGPGLVSFEEELTIEGSPLVRLGVFDPDDTLLSSGLLDDGDGKLRRGVELILDGTAYWLAQVSKSQKTYTLVFEDRTVAKLRMRKQRMKINDDTLDPRAFAARLAREVGAELITAAPGPEEKAAKERSELKKQTAREEAGRHLRPGIDEDIRSIPVADRGVMGPAEIDNANLAAALCEKYNAGPKARIALFEACIVEPNKAFENTQTASEDGYGSYGILQGRLKYNALEDILDVEYCLTRFLNGPAWTGGPDGAIALERKNPSWNPGQIAQFIEGSAHPERYENYREWAERLLAMFGAGDLSAVSTRGDAVRYRDQAMVVRRGESYWEALRQLADARGFRCYVVANVLYFITDEVLRGSAVKATIGKHSDGIDWIDWEWAPRAAVARTDVTCRAKAWQAPPGRVVRLDESCGPAAGKWIVQDYQRSRFKPDARVTLIRGVLRPRFPLEEYSPPGASPSEDGGGVIGGTGSGEIRSPFGGAFPITSGFGYRVGPPERFHMGLDVGVPYGTPCIASFDGTVTMGTTTGFGTSGGMIHLRADQDVPGTDIRAGDKIGWGHASAVGVPVGSKVRAGQRIGASGGNPAHVHFVLLRADGGGNGVDGNEDPTEVCRQLGGV